MITYTDILHSVTKELSNNFSDIDVIIDNVVGATDKCFYVTIVPVESIIDTMRENRRSLLVSIKYFDSKIKCYEMANQLELLFSRILKVKDRVLNISNLEPKFLNDEVGDMLDFLISINYNEVVYNVVDNEELIKDIEINLRK